MTISRKARCELCWIALFLCCAPILYVLVAGDNGYLQLREQRIRLRQVRQDNESLWQKNATLRATVKELESNPAALERIAREQNGLARPGDVIVNLPERQDRPAEATISDPTLD